MRFALLGEQRIRPVLLLAGISSSGNRRHHLGLWHTPISRRRLYTPYIAGGLKRKSEQEIPAVGTERQTICHARGRLYTTRQAVQQHASAWVESARQLHTAALRVHHQGMGLLGKDRSRG